MTIPPGQSNVPFVHIEEDISFPLPKPAELAAYVIYVGFDPTLVKEPEKRPEKKPSPKKPRGFLRERPVQKDPAPKAQPPRKRSGKRTAGG